MPMNIDALDKEIERKLAEAREAGEFEDLDGRPLEEGYAWLQTPPGLRMSFMVLNNAGVPPKEIELFHRRAQLRAEIEAAPDAKARASLQQQLNDLEQELNFRLQALHQRG